MYKKILFLTLTITITILSTGCCSVFGIFCPEEKIPVANHIVQLDSDSWIKYKNTEETAKITNIINSLRKKMPFFNRNQLIEYNQAYGFVYKKNGELYIDYMDPKGTGKLLTKKVQDAKNIQNEEDKPLRYRKGYPKIILYKELGKFKPGSSNFYDINLSRGGMTETIDILENSEGSSSFSFVTFINGEVSYKYARVFKATGNPYIATYTIYLKELIAEKGYAGLSKLDFWGLPKKFYTLDTFKIEKGYTTKLNVQGKLAEKGFVLTGNTGTKFEGSISKEAKNVVFGVGFIGSKKISRDSTDNRFPPEEKPFYVTELVGIGEKSKEKPGDKEDIGFVELTLNNKLYEYTIYKYSYPPEEHKSPSFRCVLKGEPTPTNTKNSVRIQFNGILIPTKELAKDKTLHQLTTDNSKTLANTIFFYLSSDNKNFGVLKTNNSYFNETDPTSNFFELKAERPKKKE